MKISLLLRGHSFLGADRFGYPMDSTVCIDSFLDFILIPMRAEHEVNIYLSTYESPALGSWVDRLVPRKVMLHDAGKSTQLTTYLNGLRGLHDDDPSYDVIFATRFDLLFLKSWNSWGVNLNRHDVLFPWREYLQYWRDHHRVGDTIHIIGANSLPSFYASIQSLSLLHKNMHLLYYIMSLVNPNLKFIEPEFWDSNTMYSNPECFNPIYKICNRPRLPGVATSFNKIIPEIMAP